MAQKKCPLCGGRVMDGECMGCGYRLPDEDRLSAPYNFDPEDYRAEGSNPDKYAMPDIDSRNAERYGAPVMEESARNIPNIKAAPSVQTPAPQNQGWQNPYNGTAPQQNTYNNAAPQNPYSGGEVPQQNTYNNSSPQNRNNGWQNPYNYNPMRQTARSPVNRSPKDKSTVIIIILFILLVMGIFIPPCSFIGLLASIKLKNKIGGVASGVLTVLFILVTIFR